METSDAAARVARGVIITFWALGKFDHVGSDMGLVRAAQAVAGKDFVTYTIPILSVPVPCCECRSHFHLRRRDAFR